MRVGIDVTCWCNRRGFGRFTRELVIALVNLPFEGEYVLFSDRQTGDIADFPKSCRVVIANTSKAAIIAASAEGRRSIKDVLVMRRMVQREELDLMFFPAVYSYFPINRGIPCIVTFHDIIAETLPKLVFRSWRSRLFWELKCSLAAKRADLVVTVSQASKKGLMDYFGFPESGIAVISEAPVSGFTEAARSKKTNPEVLERYDLKSNERYILYVGGISPHKNIETLIQAFTDVHKDNSLKDVHLVLVGDWAGDTFNTCYDKLCALVERCGIDNLVHFTGFVPDEDLVHLYKACQVFVLPSYLEGFGLPVVEAMACGAAVIASNVGSIPEILDGAGELFDPHDTAFLTDCLKRVIGDSTYQKELQKCSLQRALDFSWETSARQLREIFHKMKMKS